MRRILIDRARRKLRPKHGGDRQRLDFDAAFPANEDAPDALLAIDEALTTLEQQFPDHAQLVKLRHYAGCSLQQAGDALGISLATAKRRWSFARVYLFSQLTDEP
jgi:RNA polymerase sigma factor (TIGR02999 family)